MPSHSIKTTCPGLAASDPATIGGTIYNPAVTRISLNVIAFNEEARLEECLVDARHFVDEIVVVDQMSTDRTPEIAQRLADVYVRDVHHGHAEPSRELAASRSSGDWILVLDADERMSQILKTELRSLVERDVDGYWIRKRNTVAGVETSTILHFRLFRKSRARFDPRPHGGAVAITDNVERFEQIGILHEKSLEEQIYDDARYDQLALEEDAPTSSKRNWLGHNTALQEHRGRRRRWDLESLLPPGAHRVLVVGGARIDPPGCDLVVVDRIDPVLTGREGTGAFGEGEFDAVVVPRADRCGFSGVTFRAAARLVRPGGAVIGSSLAARNRRRIEAFLAAVLSDQPQPDAVGDVQPTGGSTRRKLASELTEAELDITWMGLVRDGWLDPVVLRPASGGTVVESADFLLTNASAEAAEELTAEEIIFAAVRRPKTVVPVCSIIVVALTGTNPQSFADALRESRPDCDYELVVVQSQDVSTSIPSATTVLVSEEAGLGARWNAGARAASGDFLVFVSAHSLPTPGWLDGLVQAHQSRPDIGAVGSKVVGSDGTVEHAGLVLGSDRVPYRIYQGDAADDPSVNRTRIMPAIAAEGMMTARSRFVSIGGFDESLADDLTDADLCMRLRSRGLAILYYPAGVLSSQLRSVSGTRGMFRRSAREFVTRWSTTALQSDDLVCSVDGRDPNWQRNCSWRLPRPTVPTQGVSPAIAWTGHFLEQGGYTEEAVAAVIALEDAGQYVVANPVVWASKGPPLPAGTAERVTAMIERDLPDDFVHVVHIGANRFKRHPAALRNIGRTMFETDGLPEQWRDQCNVMDEIWVPSEHNLRSFVKAGVDASKLYKVPETFDADLFNPRVRPLVVEGLENFEGFVFLSVFSWIDRKAWDVLLRAWFEEFGWKDDVALLIKADTNISAPGTDCRSVIDTFVRNTLKRDPKEGCPILVLDQPLESTDVPKLYGTADAFVLASHGEGWGRPYMEAMAMELPTIATRWSGNLDFMSDENSFLIDYKLVDAPMEFGLGGQQWAQPSVRQLRRTMRWVYEHRSEAAATGRRAREEVLVSCGPQLLVEAVRERMEAVDRHPIHVPVKRKAVHSKSLGPSRQRRSTKRPLRISACVVQEGHSLLHQCVASLQQVADEIVVVGSESRHAKPEALEDMASRRNEALDRATGDWVLMVDSTHTLDPASVGIVRDLVEQNRFQGYAAFELCQLDSDGAVSVVEQRSATLFPRHGGLRYVGRVREQLLPQHIGSPFQFTCSPIVLHQHDYRHDRRDPVAMARRHLPLLERSVREALDEPFHRYNLGIALHELGLFGEAESNLREAIAAAPPDALWEASALLWLSKTVGAQGRKADAVKQCKAVVELAPQWAEAWCALGGALVDAGRWKSAVRAYTRAQECAAQPPRAVGGPGDIVLQVRAGLARIHLAMEQHEEAAECLRGALALDPTNDELRGLLARAYETLGRSAEARSELERVVPAARVGPNVYATLGDLFTTKAEWALLRGLADNPENPLLLERLGRLRAARAV